MKMKRYGNKNYYKTGNIFLSRDKVPMKRLGTVEEVAAISAWTVSRECGFSTGLCLISPVEEPLIDKAKGTSQIMLTSSCKAIIQ